MFWLEHDLFDQLLLIRHLWWLTTNAADRAKSRTRFSLICGSDYLGLLKPEQFGPLFEARRTITAEQIAVGSAAWEAFCSGTRRRGSNHSPPPHHDSLPYLARRAAPAARGVSRRR